MQFEDHKVEFLDGDTKGSVVIKHTYHVPDEFIEQCKELRKVVMSRPYGEMGLHVRLPPFIVEYFVRNNYDYQREPIERTKAIMWKMGWDVFIIDTRSAS